MLSPRVARLVCGATVAAAIVACGTATDSAVRSTARRPIQAAVSEIARTRGIPVSEVALDRITAVVERSGAREHFVVHRVVYSPPGTAHMEAVVLVGERDSHVTVIRSADDLLSASAYPQIEQGTAAVEVCSDLVRWAGPARSNLSAPVRFDGTAYWSGAGWAAVPPAAARIRAPSVVKDSVGRWRVEMWFAEPGKMVGYRCTVGGEAAPELARRDSLPGLGTMPESP